MYSFISNIFFLLYLSSLDIYLIFAMITKISGPLSYMYVAVYTPMRTQICTLLWAISNIFYENQYPLCITKLHLQVLFCIQYHSSQIPYSHMVYGLHRRECRIFGTLTPSKYPLWIWFYILKSYPYGIWSLHLLYLRAQNDIISYFENLLLLHMELTSTKIEINLYTVMHVVVNISTHMHISIHILIL
jgi:hypothetical protein